MKKDLLRHSPYPVTLQCCCQSADEVPEFAGLLNLLSDYGFYGIELNLPDLKALSPSDLKSLLEPRGLKLTYIATGAYAKAHDLSLSSPDPMVRRRSIEGCKENIRYAAEFGAGVIIGFLKNSDPSTDRNSAAEWLEESLSQIDQFAAAYQVPLLLEATNRYESCVANSLDDTAQIKNQVNGSMISILPDTYHMNIEEARPFDALYRYQDSIRNIHLSDNNRFFPGLGCIAFESYLKELNTLHYQGTLGIEGILKYSMAKDLELSALYLSRILTPQYMMI
ncbi:MAG: sugar phosphate isomerase/epimerase family protein [Eubacteriales bacterium]|nr:sugar phosphate isomerase/epimerase family protein [Eubacteriales bacterium]